MKIYNGPEPKNPCEGCSAKCNAEGEDECVLFREYLAKKSILNQCVEVRKIDELADEWRNATTIYEPPYKFTGSFSQFIQSEIKKQESKDGKPEIE
jgi:hypothetical protein